MGYIEPYFGTHHRAQLFARMGIGGAYLNKSYDEESNPNNLSYSTYLSVSLLVGLGVNYQITPRMNARLAVKYNHISNGGIRTPNKGLNYPTLSAGVNRSLTEITFPRFAKTGKREAPDPRNRFSVAFLSGWSNVTEGRRSTYYVTGLMAEASRWMIGRSALSIGTEWIVDYSRKEQFRIREDAPDESFHEGALLVGHAFWLGRVTFSQQFGIYYFNHYRDGGDVYQRYGLTFHFTPHLFGGFNLKAHGHVADFPDFRIGYTL